MRAGIGIDVSASDYERLLAVIVDRNSRQKHAWRVRSVTGAIETSSSASAKQDHFKY
jgi:hypothetical protein